MSPAPTITVFVRHSSDCKYKDDELYRRCNCRKHLRWFANGQQFRRSANTRSWSEAEEVKRDLADPLSGRVVVVMLCAVGKEAVAENHSSPLDDDNDTLLFEKVQEHILAHYPNPERKGCPGPAVLKSLIDNPGDITLTELNDLQIFKCAECTRLLMELRQKKKQRDAPE